MADVPTIRDVSKLAGVSVKTVSRVINKHRYVNAETRERIEEAMRTLGFRPNMAARVLAGTSSGQIALIYDNHSPYYVYDNNSACYLHQILDGCWSRCHDDGIRLVALPVNITDSDVGEQVKGLILEAHVEGVILSSPVTDCQPVLTVLEQLGQRFVRISPGTNLGLASSVCIDDAQAADDLTTHLISLGHRRIGFVIGHPNHMASGERLYGYRRALDRAGIPYEPQLVAEGKFDFDSGYTAAARFLDLPQAPTAIFASNDDMAAGVLALAHARGLQLPADLSVAGFDDTPLAKMVWPALTTIHQPTRDLAFTATDLLLKGHGIEHRRLTHNLVVRNSICPPRGAASSPKKGKTTS